MKTKLILGSFLALATIADAQWGTMGTHIYNTNVGNVGIGTGTSSPTDLLNVVTPSTTAYGGITVRGQYTGGTAWLRMSAKKTSGQNTDWIIGSEGNTRNFVIYDGRLSTTRVAVDSTGKVGIGILAPSANLHINTPTSIGVGIRSDANSSGADATAVAGNGIGSGGSGYIAGISGRAYGGAINTAGFFASTGSSLGITTYGVYSEVYSPSAGGLNYGVYSTVGGNSGGSTPNPLALAGYFNGDVVTTSSQYYTSDKRMKKNILTLDNSLQIIKKLNPVSYSFDTESNPYMALPFEKQYGFLSQEIKEILPELTKTIIHPAKLDENGKEIAPNKEFLGLNYNGFIAILTKGVQEQQIHIESLEKQLDEQKQLIDALTQKASGTTGINDVNTVETGFQMSQNMPNPFTHETVVKYTLPTTISNAFMAVYDLTGKQITTFPINERGNASVALTSDKLSAGIYIYSIVADGQVVDSKRMIVAEK